MATDMQITIKGRKVPLSKVKRVDIINGPSTLQLAVAYAYAWKDRATGRPEQLVTFFVDKNTRLFARIIELNHEDGSGDSHCLGGFVRKYTGQVDSQGNKIYREYDFSGYYDARIRQGWMNVALD